MIKKVAAGGICAISAIIAVMYSNFGDELILSRAGAEIIGDAEGCRRDPYKCPADVLTDRRAAHDVINDICSIFRAMPVWNGREFTLVQDRPADPVWTYTNANVANGEFTYQYSAMKSRHNALQVEYVDASNNYEKSIEYISDDESIRRYGLNSQKVTAFGCTNRDNIPKFILNSQEYTMRALAGVKIEVNAELVGKIGFGFIYSGGGVRFVDMPSDTLPAELNTQLTRADDVVVLFAYDIKHNSNCQANSSEIENVKQEFISNYVDVSMSQEAERLLARLREQYAGEWSLESYELKDILENGGEPYGSVAWEFNQAHPDVLKSLVPTYKARKAEIENKLERYQAGEISFDELI